MPTNTNPSYTQLPALLAAFQNDSHTFEHTHTCMADVIDAFVNDPHLVYIMMHTETEITRHTDKMWAF